MPDNANLYSAYAAHFPADRDTTLLTTASGETLSYGEV